MALRSKGLIVSGCLGLASGIAFFGAYNLYGEFKQTSQSNPQIWELNRLDRVMSSSLDEVLKENPSLEQYVELVRDFEKYRQIDTEENRKLITKIDLLADGIILSGVTGLLLGASSIRNLYRVIAEKT